LPEHLAGAGVEAHDALLLVDALADLVVDVDPAVHHDGRRAAAVGLLPQEIVGLLLVVRPRRRQLSVGRDAVVHWAAPARPLRAEQRGNENTRTERREGQHGLAAMRPGMLRHALPHFLRIPGFGFAPIRVHSWMIRLAFISKRGSEPGA